MVYIKNFIHVLYEDHSFSIVGLMWQIVCFPQDQFNFHSWVTAKFSRDITGLHTLNCYIRKQILYFARLIDEQRKFLQTANRLIYASVEAVTLAETIVMQINIYNAKYCTNLNERSVTDACCSVPANSSVNDLAQKHYSKGSRSQVMLLKMSMTRCCETARLSMRSFNYPIKLLVFPLQNILLGHADFRRHDWITKCVEPSFTHEIHTNSPCLLLGNLFKYAVFCRK